MRDLIPDQAPDHVHLKIFAGASNWRRAVGGDFYLGGGLRKAPDLRAVLLRGRVRQ